MVAGYYSANGQLYRFAAGELAAPSEREKAVSLVLAGGLIGAIAGPNLANHTRDVLGGPFLGAYLALAVVALFLLGVGWNFLFTGSTTLAMQAYRAEEKDRAQALINFGVFATMALTSFASGALVTTQGWWWLNVGSTVPVAVIAVALAALAWRQRTAAAGSGT